MTSDVEARHLNRSLKGRHVQLIALGGAIGVGLFLGSAKAIHAAGPGLLLAYALCGAVVFCLMRGLGELMVYRPVAGSFVIYAEEFLGPLAGFITGWSYWFMWVVSCMAELTAIGIYFHLWFPDLPQWIPALVFLVCLYGSNLLAVGVFGELEFWFALIKVALILALLVIGTAILLFGVSNLGASARIPNLWNDGGWFPIGVLGVVLSLQAVIFAFQGVEVIGITAGEAENPAVTLPQAIKGVTYRILLFYMGSLAMIMALIPWRQLDPNTSPFVTVFQRIGLPGAASVVTFVVITSAASACNTGIFSTGRMLYSLARDGLAPPYLARLSPKGVPLRGITVSSVFMLTGVALNYMVPNDVFIWVTSISLLGTFWTWTVIMLAHRRYRHAVAAGLARGVDFRLPMAGFSTWFVIVFLVGVALIMCLRADTRVALYVAPLWFGLLAASYRRYVKPARDRALICQSQSTNWSE